MRSVSKVTCYPPIELQQARPRHCSFEGRAAELFAYDAYWLAIRINTTATLLVGSIAHVLGGQARPTGESALTSASVDAQGAAEAFLHGEDHEDNRWVYAFIWSSVMANALRTTPPDGLRTLRGVAENRGLRYGEEQQLGQAGLQGEISRLILGAPLYVEGA
jgi:hypothetical protein